MILSGFPLGVNGLGIEPGAGYGVLTATLGGAMQDLSPPSAAARAVSSERRECAMDPLFSFHVSADLTPSRQRL